MSKDISVEALDGKLTFAELKEFVADLQAAAVMGSTVITGRVAMSGAVKSLKASG